jgi:hypothetical protein
MAQQLELELKLQPSVSHSLGHSTLHGKYVLLHPGIKGKEGDSVAFDSKPPNHSQDDYPDGGLHGYCLVVLGSVPYKYVFLPNGPTPR